MSAQKKLASEGRQATPSPPSWSPSRTYFPLGQAAKVRMGHKRILTTKLQGEMPQDKEKAERGQVQQGLGRSAEEGGHRGAG